MPDNSDELFCDKEVGSLIPFINLVRIPLGLFFFVLQAFRDQKEPHEVDQP